MNDANALVVRQLSRKGVPREVSVGKAGKLNQWGFQVEDLARERYWRQGHIYVVAV
jgi:hypothetical protein